jgi:hypothetical protein
VRQFDQFAFPFQVLPLFSDVPISAAQLHRLAVLSPVSMIASSWRA